ncbi:MAG: OmpA family protein, partial [Bacteroidota bacterium]
DKLAYELAIPYYERYLAKRNDPDAVRRLAISYRLTHNYPQAVKWYDRVVFMPEAEPLDFFYYGHALLQNGNREGAREMFANYDKKALYINGKRDLRGQNFLEALDRYADLMRDSARVTLDMLPFNTDETEFGTWPYQNGLIFAATRKGGPPVVHEFNWMDRPFLNFYYAEKAEDSVNWKEPETLKGDVNSRFHESNFTMVEGESEFYFTRNNFLDRKKGKSEEGIIKLKIFKGEISGVDVSNIEEFPFNSEEYSVTHPALSADGQTLFYCSDKPGGEGGKDIYMTTKQGDSWSDPVNLREINTPGDEAFPFVHADGTLYFASDGHPGLGHLDIFYVKLDGSRQAVNMGYPINTAYDDFAFHMLPNNEEGYFSSNRPSGAGRDDIYHFTLKRPKVEIFVLDSLLNVPLENTMVEVTDETEGWVQEFETDSLGRFLFDTEYGHDFTAKTRHVDYMSKTMSMRTDAESGQAIFTFYIRLHNPPPSLTALVVDDSTKKRLPGAQVTMEDLSTGYVVEKTADKFGRIILNMDADERYEVTVTHPGYLVYSLPIYTAERAYRGDTIFPLKLKRIPFGRPILLENIHYDFDKWFIKAEAYGDLEKVALLMTKNPEIIVELGSHTDSRGSDKYNERLSQKRANSAKTHLVLNFGIDPNRVTAKGYGEYKLANECSNGVPCSEDKHFANRRTEFTITGTIDGYDMENSVLKTDERGDNAPEYEPENRPDDPIVEPPKTPEQPKTSEEPKTPDTQFEPGESEELDTEKAVDPEKWDNADQDGGSGQKAVAETPEPVEMPAAEENPVEKAAEEPAKEAPITGTNPSDFTGDASANTGNGPQIGPSGFILPDQKYDPRNDSDPETTYFRIRVGSFRGALSKPAQERLRDYQRYLFVREEENGMKTYLVGEFLNVTHAKLALDKVKECGYYGAYISAFIGGKELSYGELRKLLAE